MQKITSSEHTSASPPANRSASRNALFVLAAAATAASLSACASDYTENAGQYREAGHTTWDGVRACGSTVGGVGYAVTDSVGITDPEERDRSGDHFVVSVGKCGVYSVQGLAEGAWAFLNTAALLTGDAVDVARSATPSRSNEQAGYAQDYSPIHVTTEQGQIIEGFATPDGEIIDRYGSPIGRLIPQGSGDLRDLDALTRTQLAALPPAEESLPGLGLVAEGAYLRPAENPFVLLTPDGRLLVRATRDGERGTYTLTSSAAAADFALEVGGVVAFTLPDGRRARLYPTGAVDVEGASGHFSVDRLEDFLPWRASQRDQLRDGLMRDLAAAGFPGFSPSFPQIT